MIKLQQNLLKPQLKEGQMPQFIYVIRAVPVQPDPKWKFAPCCIFVSPSGPGRSWSSDIRASGWCPTELRLVGEQLRWRSLQNVLKRSRVSLSSFESLGTCSKEKVSFFFFFWWFQKAGDVYLFTDIYIFFSQSTGSLEQSHPSEMFAFGRFWP